MTEDEKKAIEYLMLMKDRMEFNRLGYVYGADSIDIILNLIEKQQKEIEDKDTLLKCASEVIENSVPKEAIIEKFNEIFDIIESEQFKVIMGDTTKCSRIKYILKEILGDDKK